jgi:hypothetical protein
MDTQGYARWVACGLIYIKESAREVNKLGIHMTTRIPVIVTKHCTLHGPVPSAVAA